MVRHTVCIALLATSLTMAIQGSSRADENFRWRVDHYDTLVNKAETTYFETEQEAQDYKRKWEKVQNLSKGGPAYVNWRITKESKAAKPAAEKPKDSKDGQTKDSDILKRLRTTATAVALAIRQGAADLAKKEILLREAIDDYKQAVADTFRRIKEFEKTLVGGTQEMQEARFREINALVDRYNRQIADFQAVMGPKETLGYKPLPRFQPPAPKNNDAAASVADKPASIDLSGAWQTERIVKEHGGATRTYVGTMQLRKSGDGYVGEWNQTYPGDFGGQERVVQDVSVSVTGDGITVKGANPRKLQGSSSYYADTMYLTVKSSTSMSGRDLDTSSQPGACRVWR